MQGLRKCVVSLTCVAVLSAFVYAAVVWAKSDQGNRPHIVFILADDMGWNDVSFHGADQIPTPNIDALAYNGVILNRHYVMPICTPSRTALLTGRYAIREGMQGWPLRAGEPRAIPLATTLMPEYLRRLGYSTHLVGKWHLGYLSEHYTPARRGFDSFFGCYNGFISFFGHWAQQTRENLTTQFGHDLHRDGPHSLGATYDPKYITDLITDEAEKIIKSNGGHKPLFLEIAHAAVHASDAEDQLEVRSMTEVNATFPYIRDIRRRRYAGMMKAMDESVGRIVTALDDAKMLENSIIIFISDNGAPTIGLYENTGSNYPLRGVKHTLFEGGVRGAACIFSPLIKSPVRVSEDLMHISDWLPTLYNAAGGDSADLRNIDGVNQWPMIVNGSASARQSVLLNIDEVAGVEAAIIGKHKYIKSARDDNDGYYGDSGNNLMYPIYHVEEALSSVAGLTISRIPNFLSPSTSEAQKLRHKSTIRCKPTSSQANCAGYCLFDIQKDPCETQDISQQYPEVVENLASLIEGYRKVAMAQTNAPLDPCADPKYFNSTWMPWRKNDILSNLVSDNNCQHPEY